MSTPRNIYSLNGFTVGELDGWRNSYCSVLVAKDFEGI